MGDPTDFYDVLNIPKDSTHDQIRKAYKALVRKWHPDKNPPSSKHEAEAKFKSITQAYEALSGSGCRTMFGVYNSVDGTTTGGGGGGKGGGPSWLSFHSPLRQQHKSEEGGNFFPSSTSTTRRPINGFYKSEENTPLPRSTSTTRRPINGFYKSEENTPLPRSTSTTRRPINGFYRSEEVTPLPRSTSTTRRPNGFYPTSTTTTSPATGATATTMFFKRKPPPIERRLECTLEELFLGCKKEVRYTRDVIGKNGIILKKEEVQTVRVKPGWKKGTKVTFEEKGDERPGSLPSDVVFLIAEKEHPYFKRVGNDLVLKVEIPLVNALTGWTFSFRLLSGEKMSCSFENEIINPGYEKVVQGEGMPLANQKGARGDLRIKFSIVFPKHLGAEQRSELRKLLKGCT